MYYYRCIKEEQSLPETGRYTTFGITALTHTRGRWRKLLHIADVSLNYNVVQELARKCTVLQLSPCHLMDVVEDTI